MFLKLGFSTNVSLYYSNEKKAIFFLVQTVVSIQLGYKWAITIFASSLYTINFKKKTVAN